VLDLLGIDGSLRDIEPPLGIEGALNLGDDANFSSSALPLVSNPLLM
jgi:hypothetical protein